MNSTTKFLLGFIAGALSGATVGLLLAPDKGEETRKLIVDKFDELAQKGKDFYETKKTKTTQE
ncbi:MAG: YtxH domain-containing protein [Bacteroidales bacterium]|nr:YtxH domain-containing protein [Bacteroidales bacterium]